MAREDEKPDGAGAPDGDDASRKQATKGPSAQLQILLADFRTRSKGLEGPELQAELDRLIEKMVDRAAGVAPPAVRAKVRDAIYEMLLNDPTMKTLMDDVRRTARS
jgi:hypothetical protein